MLPKTQAANSSPCLPSEWRRPTSEPSLWRKGTTGLRRELETSPEVHSETSAPQRLMTAIRLGSKSLGTESLQLQLSSSWVEQPASKTTNICCPPHIADYAHLAAGVYIASPICWIPARLPNCWSTHLHASSTFTRLQRVSGGGSYSLRRLTVLERIQNGPVFAMLNKDSPLFYHHLIVT